ncbi:hypothetical protein NZD89_29185 (plasmid) [Alicyclobacillus fastidiosus]|uniref:Uncharacterized protein n=1 Tax=Alicyclobacillus fastidiosus TaxID=392011 RepID=A0ABY6ZQ71_9BACL|nr:hypothetical protein NZD89_29185 [Alicyclobacillus fastidiosus]
MMSKELLMMLGVIFRLNSLHIMISITKIEEWKIGTTETKEVVLLPGAMSIREIKIVMIGKVGLNLEIGA